MAEYFRDEEGQDGTKLSHRLATWGLDSLASRAEPLKRGPCQTMGPYALSVTYLLTP